MPQIHVFVPSNVLITKCYYSSDRAKLIDTLRKLVGENIKLTLHKDRDVKASTESLTYKVGTIHTAENSDHVSGDVPLLPRGE